MRKYKFFSGILLCIFTYFLVFPAFATDSLHESDSVPAPPPHVVEAYGAILLDAENGEVLFAQNADAHLYPASTTKLMTAYLTLKYGDPWAWITVPDGIYIGIGEGASTANLKSGEEMYVYELLQCLMIVSANEAANALAIYISGSVENFVTLMNEEAAALGCTNTHFVNTHGMHDEDHYTTARDLSKIALAAMKYDTLLEITSMSEATIRETNLSEERKLQNTNYLLPNNIFPDYGFDGTFGLKTGYTSPAGACLVAANYRGERILLSVVLGAERTVTDTETITESFPQTKALMEWGYNNYDVALVYQDYLETLPEPTPEPSPEPSPDPTPEPTPDPTPTPAASPSPSPSVEPSPSSVPTEEPVPVLPSPTPEPNQDAMTTETMLSAVANTFGISVEVLLLSVIGLASLLLILMIVIFVRMLRSGRRK